MNPVIDAIRHAYYTARARNPATYTNGARALAVEEWLRHSTDAFIADTVRLTSPLRVDNFSCIDIVEFLREHLNSLHFIREFEFAIAEQFLRACVYYLDAPENNAVARCVADARTELRHVIAQAPTNLCRYNASFNEMYGYVVVDIFAKVFPDLVAAHRISHLNGLPISRVFNSDTHHTWVRLREARNISMRTRLLAFVSQLILRIESARFRADAVQKGVINEYRYNYLTARSSYPTIAEYYGLVVLRESVLIPDEYDICDTLFSIFQQHLTVFVPPFNAYMYMADSNVAAILKAARVTGDYSSYTILADAMQDAGYEDAAVLARVRSLPYCAYNGIEVVANLAGVVKF